MSFHRNAKLGLSGRFALVEAVASGMSLKAAAAAFRVSPATAHRWWHRWLDASESEHALPHWLNHYNTRRPHSSIADRPPISRAHNVRG